MKTLKITKTVVGLLIAVAFTPVMAMASTEDSAYDRHLAEAGAAPHIETYKFSDGDGEYAGQAPKKWDAHGAAWESCITQKVSRYEAARGNTPDADTTDMIIDSCINK